MSLPRGSLIGILGDGQLGRMLATAAQRRGFKVQGYGQDPGSPLAQVTPLFTCAAFDDVPALTAFAHDCALVTSEFENVPLAALTATRCRPSAQIFAQAQDRLKEKQTAQTAGLATAPFICVDTLADLHAAHRELGGSGVLKTRRQGYDGKGQWRLRPSSDLPLLWQTTPQADLILEGVVPFAFETSVLVARNARGQAVTFPCGENIHQGGLLYQCRIPGRMTPALTQQAQRDGTILAQQLGLQGLLAVEFFVLDDGGLVFNEMAPRPHNSGHWTIEGCDQSQFDLAVSALIDEDLRTPNQHCPAVMTNILGTDILRPQAGAHLHWHDYGKAIAKPGRKMGHVTVLEW